MKFKKGTRLKSGVKFTPNEEYWAEVEAFWRQIRQCAALREDLIGWSWSGLNFSQRSEVAELLKATKKNAATQQG